MGSPDLPVLLDEALRALDAFTVLTRPWGTLREFLESLHQMQTILPPAPDAPLDDYVTMEHAYALGARCVTVEGDLIVIPRAALLALVRQLRRSE